MYPWVCCEHSSCHSSKQAVACHLQCLVLQIHSTLAGSKIGSKYHNKSIQVVVASDYTAKELDSSPNKIFILRNPQGLIIYIYIYHRKNNFVMLAKYLVLQCVTPYSASFMNAVMKRIHDVGSDT